MELNIIGGGSVQAPDAVFAAPFRAALVHQVVTAYLAGGRSGTKAQKSRSTVNGTTKKSKRQKGGGARHGALTAPIFVGGGITFAAAPRDFRQKVNRKMYRAGMRAILAELQRQERLRVVPTLEIAEPRTRLVRDQLREWAIDGRVLLVAPEVGSDWQLATRNMPYVDAVRCGELDPASLVAADYVVLTADAVRQIGEWLA